MMASARSGTSRSFVPSSCAAKVLGEAILHDSCENAPGRADAAAECSADLGCADPWMIADRHLDDPKSASRTFHDHLDGPSVRLFAKTETDERVVARGTKRPEIGEADAAHKTDEPGREPITEDRMPRH